MRVMHRLIAVVALSACACSGRARAMTPLEACTAAIDRGDSSAKDLCQRAWDATHDITAAVASARVALMRDDYESLKTWALKAPETLEGARILHFWGEMQGGRGEFDGAEATLRHALALRRDVDPGRAANTAVTLLPIVRSRRPAKDSIDLAYLAWEQANRAGGQILPMAATALTEVLLDLGELRTADKVVAGIDLTSSPVMHALALGHIETARGHPETALALLRDAAAISIHDLEAAWALDIHIELANAQLAAGKVAQAVWQVALASALSQELASTDTESIDRACRLAAVQAAVALAWGDPERALAAADHGLRLRSRDAARVRLLNVRGDVLARSGRWQDAERAWRQASDEVETWRASVPSLQMRSGIVAYHRHALEAWLDSSATRGDAAAAVEIMQRMIGRGLLDRMREQASTAADTTLAVKDVAKRLADRDQLAGVVRTGVPSLLDVRHDVVAFMVGERSVWAIRHAAAWTVSRVGDRDAILALVDTFRSNPDDAAVAAKLGTALFPQPPSGTTLAVVLDRDLSDIALAGLRTGDKFLIEHAPIVELLVPDLLFHDLPARTWSQPVVIGDPRGNLPAARREAEQVAHALGGRAAIGPDATRATLLGAGAARTLHIATHSAVDDGRAAFVMSDGSVSSYDVVTHQIAPRLAVIATCRSQVDDDPDHSLVAAFLAAGAGGVIGVKRAIDDAAGERLITDFYAARGDEDPAGALAAAQRKAIASGREPHDWAAFSFFGTGGWLATRRAQ